MNRTLPLILTAALLLTACASAVPAQSADATTSPSAAASSPAQPDAAASSPSQPAAETSAPPLTPKFPVGHLLTLPQSQTSGPVWNTGDALYELRDASNMTPEALVLKTDYAALTQSVYCDIPGCTHDSDACPAYLASDFCVGVMAVDGTVYTYPGELTNVAPTQIYRIDPAVGKTPVAAVPDALPHHMQLLWCDEYALYGCPLAASHQPGTLYRWDWRNDTVQTIPMLADEKIIACEGSRFLTIRIEANEPFPNFGSTEQEKAILAHAVYVYAWLDPATGAREKICTRPYADGYFHNYYDGRIYYTGNFRNADTPGQQAALLYFDTADGTEKTLLETIPLDTYGIDVCAPFSPAFAGVPQRYLCVQNAGDANADCLLDMETGDVLPAPAVTAEGVRRPALLLACTASGQWLATANPRDSYDPQYSLYALWDPADFLADGQPAAWVTMYATE